MDDEKSFPYEKSKSGSFKRRSRNQFDNGKKKRRNPYPSHDQNSVTSKVIETLYRILCPVKKIGSVLGKGGDIVNALRNETHAKIRVADAIRGAEDRVIIIFNYPSKEEKLDNDEDPEIDDFAMTESDNMKIHCPAQDALLKVHDRIAADEYLRGGVIHEKADPDEAVTVRILVPSNQVGCLIGKGGTVIQKLRSDHTGASIRVFSAEHLPPCAMNTDELVQISGMPAIVKKALYDVSTRLHQHPRKENPSIDELIYASTQGLFHPGPSMPPPSQGRSMHPDAYGSPPPPWYGGHKSEPYGYPPNTYNSSRNRNGEEAPEEFCMRILCPAGRIGGVIGKSGANVRQIEHQTRARIQVEDTSPDAEERIINVSSMESPWDPISPTIEAVLQLQVRTTASSEDGTITTRLLVPSSKAGCLLGERGSIITEMRRRTRADIKMYAKEDKPNYTSANEELVQISGNHNVAREALLEIASRLRTRTFRSGNPAHVHQDRGIVPQEGMSGRGRPSSGMIGAAGNPPPVYHTHGFAPPDNIPSRGPPPSAMTRGGNANDYEYSKGHGPTYETSTYRTGPTYEASSYRTGPPYEPSSYRSGPPYEAPSYRTDPPYEASSYRTGPPYETSKYPTGPTFEPQGYPCPPIARGYASMSSPMEEVKVASNVVQSVHGVDGNTISDIRQDPLAGGTNAPQPPPRQPMYHPY